MFVAAGEVLKSDAGNCGIEINKGVVTVLRVSSPIKGAGLELHLRAGQAAKWDSLNCADRNSTSARTLQYIRFTTPR